MFGVWQEGVHHGGTGRRRSAPATEEREREEGVQVKPRGPRRWRGQGGQFLALVSAVGLGVDIPVEV